MDETALNREVGKRINELRLRYGMSQSDLSSKMGISRPMLSRFENGLSQLSLEQIVCLINIFDVSFDYLINGEQNSEGNQKVTFNGNLKGNLSEEVRSKNRERLPSDVLESGDAVPLVPMDAVAGFDLSSEAYSGAASEHIWVPGFGGQGRFAFRIKGESMVPTLFDEDVVICRPVMNDEIKPKSVYIIDYKEGLKAKRVGLAKNGYILMSDNPSALPELVLESEVNGMFEVEARITRRFDHLDYLEDQIQNLRMDIETIKRHLSAT